MADAVLRIHANVDLRISIVWIPMVAADSETAARESSNLFRDHRVRQFWDAERACGLAFSHHVFSGWARQAFSDLSDKERSRATLYVHADAPPAVLVGPDWCLDKPRVLEGIRAELGRRDSWQGKAGGSNRADIPARLAARASSPCA